jgi:hypothetical protein
MPDGNQIASREEDDPRAVSQKMAAALLPRHHGLLRLSRRAH